MIALLACLQVEALSPVRPLVATWFLLLTPGMAVTGLLDPPDAVHRSMLSVGISVAASTVVATSLVYAGAWSWSAALLILIAVSLLAVLVDSARDVRVWRSRIVAARSQPTVGRYPSPVITSDAGAATEPGALAPFPPAVALSHVGGVPQATARCARCGASLALPSPGSDRSRQRGRRELRRCASCRLLIGAECWSPTGRVCVVCAAKRLDTTSDSAAAPGARRARRASSRRPLPDDGADRRAASNRGDGPSRAARGSLVG